MAASWLLRVDKEDQCTIIKTLLAEARYRELGRDGFVTEGGARMAFQTHTGAPQGGVSSSPIWGAVFDILLRALDVRAPGGSYTIGWGR